MRNNLLPQLILIIALTLGLHHLPFLKSYAQAQNIVPNPSMETVTSYDPARPEEWWTNTWDNNTATFSYVSDAHTGTKAIKVDVSAYSSGDSKWWFVPQPVTAGTTYTISDWYKSNITTRVVVWFTLGNGTDQYIEIDSATASAANWKQYTSQVTAPANATKMSVFHLVSQVGWLITDDYSVSSAPVTTPTSTPTVTQANTPTPTLTPSLTPTSTPGVTLTPTSTPAATPTPTVTPVTGTNLISNPSVESGTSTLPTGWQKQKWGTQTNSMSYVKTQGHTSSRSLKVQITKYTSGDAKWYFTPVNVTPGDSYHYSDWYKANIPSHVVIDFTNTDNTHYYVEIGSPSAATAWTKFAASFQVPPNARSMTVYHLINQVGWLQTDDFSLTKVENQGFDRPLVSITFDDGWEDNVSTALPIMKNLGLRGTYFFATTFLENAPQTGAVGVAGPPSVQAIKADGHEIGSHSVTHPDLTTVNSADLQYELTHSKQYLESIVGAGKIKSFASPFGAYNDAVIAALQANYSNHRPTDEGFNTPLNLNGYTIKVQNMLSTTTVDQLKSWVDQAVANKSWLVLVYHRVADSNLSTYDTPLSTFGPQMEYIKNSGATVLPMAEALSEAMGQ